MRLHVARGDGTPALADRLLAVPLIPAGVAIVVGSCMPWGNANDHLQTISEWSGVALGPGWLTIVAGLVIGVLGASVAAGRVDPWTAGRSTITLCLITLAVVGLTEMLLWDGAYDGTRGFGLHFYDWLGDGIPVCGAGVIVGTIVGTGLMRVGRRRRATIEGPQRGHDQARWTPGPPDPLAGAERARQRALVIHRAPWVIALNGLVVPMVGSGFVGWPFALGWLIALVVAWALGRADPGTREQRIASALVLLPVLAALGEEGGWWLIPADLAWLAIELHDARSNPRRAGPQAVRG